MKKIRQFSLATLVIFISMAARAQTVKTYAAEWKKIDELIQKQNLPKTALAEVKKIYALAKKEGQPAQVIKALVYRVNLQQQTVENSLALSIKELETELKTTSEPAASILKSLIATLYLQYYQQHRWQLYNRTATQNFYKEDIATWSLDDFHKKISALYLESIAKKQALQNTKLSGYEAIIVKGNVRHLRPTLYDLLAHQALDYFRNGERDIKNTSVDFNPPLFKAFSPAAEFAAFSFGTTDSLSSQHIALTIYQELIRLHLKDTNKDALIDADIQRIAFVNAATTGAAKEELYLAALQQIVRQYNKPSATAQAQFLIASYYNELATSYQPLKDTTNRYARIKAKELLEKVVSDSTVKGEGWTNSYNLLHQITTPQFSFEIEKVAVPQLPFRALVKYNGVNGLQLRIVKATDGLKESLERSDNKYWALLQQTTALKTWNQPLPQTADLQEHSVEIKIDALPAGGYILIATTSDKTHQKGVVTGAQLFHVSNISYVNRQSRFFVLHRQTGQPLSGASVAVYNRQYDYNNQKYTRQKRGTYTSNSQGFFEVEANGEKSNDPYFLDIRYDDDALFLYDPIYQYRSYNVSEKDQKEEQKKTFLFADRAIYRPGQMVHFKGIVVTTANSRNAVAANYKTTVLLHDANRQLIDSVEVTTNEFGSFSGTFTLPQSGLNGAYQISDSKNKNNVSVAVEEYKRPRFYVDFEKIKTGYKVGDTVTLSGLAKAYSGNNIEGAKVVYRVVRQARFPYPWLLWRGWWPPTAPAEITHGTTTTDTDGGFTVSFAALPDKKINKELEPLFEYVVYADVTDLTGETRSAENSVAAGYKSLMLKTNIPEKAPVNLFKSLAISTENWNGQSVPSQVSVTISKLLPEQRLIRKRYWEEPDQFVFTKAEFVSLFPTDEYQNESNPKTWQKGVTVFSVKDSVKPNGLVSIQNAALATGFYQLEIVATGANGEQVKDVRVVELYNPTDNTLPGVSYLWAKKSDTVEPGEQTGVQIGTSAKDVFLIKEVEKSSQKGSPQVTFDQLNSEKKNFVFRPSDEDRGGFGVSFFFVKDNRFYNVDDVISVPWSNKKIEVEFASFRDKTLPGSQEQWTVKLKGNKGEKLAAEMLASMYDASLDQFTPHSWNTPQIWTEHARLFNWQATQNFSAVFSNQQWTNGEYKEYQKVYDRFLFNERGNYYSNIQLRSKAAGIATDARGQLNEVVMESAPVQNQTGAVKLDTSLLDATTPKNTVSNEASNVYIRKNFNETAFFFPHLKSDADGNVSFSFTAPEALTTWKVQALSHTKDLAFGLAQKEIITQKELMVQPAAPRFLRQGDRLEFSAKIVNLSTRELTGQAEFQLVDAATGQSVDGWFLNSFPNQYFTVAAGSSQVVKFPMEVPFQFTSSLIWRVIAKAENFSDGEEAALPVLTNKALVTETLPIIVRGSGTTNLTFEKLLSSNSPTLLHHALTVEYTSNPAWLAVQALPFLMQSENESTEGVWNRFYANALATKILQSSPRIKQIFATWKTFDTTALLSNLQKNGELKSALLEETPWVLDAKTEGEQKRHIALLFDMVRMSAELKNSLQKVNQAQSSNGGFVWMKGAPDDRFITQYIATGIGHLRKLGAVPQEEAQLLSAIEKQALSYLDKKIAEDYTAVLKSKEGKKNNNLGALQIQYLYLRSLTNVKPAAVATAAIAYYTSQAKTFWMQNNSYLQGMIALALNKSGDKKTANAILASLKERAIVTNDKGMYWKDQRYGFSPFWWQAPIETQSLLIEAFTEIGANATTIDNLKTWLLINKQTNNWRTTKATADACFALLLQGANWLETQPAVQIKLGNTVVNSADEKTEAGTGYFKKTIAGPLVKPAMGNISLTVAPEANQTGQKGSAPSWGAVYWQYFEDMDKITAAATPLKLEKKLFVQTNTANGPVLKPVTQATTLNKGDKLKVRIELRVDRDMEYVHMKDLRASGLEPVNVLSGFKWQGGLGYYETTKDASTSFFFSYLRKGTYVFEYPVFVAHSGDFSNGITTVQSLYAPEFSAHSEGVRIRVE